MWESINLELKAISQVFISKSSYPIEQPHIAGAGTRQDLCGMKKKDQAKAEQMRQHIEACNKSGLTVSAYCIQNSIVKSNYYYWLKKLNGENKASGFVALSVGKSALVEITYPNGVQLSFSGEIDVTTLKALVCCI